MPPEYVRDSVLTYSVDTYAFGVVMLEMITSRNPYCAFSASTQSHAGPNVDLVAATAEARQHFAEGRQADLTGVVDLQLGIPEIQLQATVTMANACLVADHTARPAMKTVAERLAALLAALNDTT
jgi:serine/threonine protein kinase